MGEASVEYGKKLDWSSVSDDYLRHRNGYPPSFFKLLRALKIGLPGQTILDLGTGTGALAVPFAKHKALVTGVDLAEGQIQAARKRAESLKVPTNFIVTEAEKTGLPDQAFDVVTASMCWGYFDKGKVVPEVKRLLRPHGLLLISSILWVPQPGTVGEKTNELISRFNPEYEHRHAVNLDRNELPDWTPGHFRRQVRDIYNEPLPFTREGWRGRIRASKWIGAALSRDRIDAFDAELEKLLAQEPLEFQVLHAISFEIYERA
jgi:ubiquinone/menaquinone biosynthesis C-methylase UbiE